MKSALVSLLFFLGLVGTASASGSVGTGWYTGAGGSPVVAVVVLAGPAGSNYNDVTYKQSLSNPDPNAPAGSTVMATSGALQGTPGPTPGTVSAAPEGTPTATVNGHTATGDTFRVHEGTGMLQFKNEKGKWINLYPQKEKASGLSQV